MSRYHSYSNSFVMAFFSVRGYFHQDAEHTRIKIVDRKLVIWQICKQIPLTRTYPFGKYLLAYIDLSLAGLSEEDFFDGSLESDYFSGLLKIRKRSRSSSESLGLTAPTSSAQKLENDKSNPPSLIATHAAEEIATNAAEELSSFNPQKTLKEHENNS